MKSYIVAILVSLSLIACASSKPKTDSSAATQATAPAASTAQTGNANAVVSPEAQMLAQVQKSSVYFDFNKSAVKAEFGNVLQSQADFLKSHKKDMVTVAGNCDERGSEKYNLALGSRRAIAVSKALQHLGVKKSQIRTISYGKDQPRLSCHDESCWKENRRVDFVHRLGN